MCGKNITIPFGATLCVCLCSTGVEHAPTRTGAFHSNAMATNNMSTPFTNIKSEIPQFIAMIEPTSPKERVSPRTLPSSFRITVRHYLTSGSSTSKWSTSNCSNSKSTDRRSTYRLSATRTAERRTTSERTTDTKSSTCIGTRHCK
ncbi:MAG: hypothetical protein [Circoviridae sp.]|nr:MAG: hypothetical protein [Circoviridae sp.]